MADYPSIDYTADSDVDDLDGREIERTDAGGLRGRSLWSGVKRAWRLTHIVDSTDAATLRSHHAAHIDATFSFTDLDTSTTHTVAYAGPQRRSYLGGASIRVVNELAEV